jgi:hypothetical protein
VQRRLRLGIGAVIWDEIGKNKEERGKDSEELWERFDII